MNKLLGMTGLFAFSLLGITAPAQADLMQKSSNALNQGMARLDRFLGTSDAHQQDLPELLQSFGNSPGISGLTNGMKSLSENPTYNKFHTTAGSFSRSTQAIVRDAANSPLLSKFEAFLRAILAKLEAGMKSISSGAPCASVRDSNGQHPAVVQQRTRKLVKAPAAGLRDSSRGSQTRVGH